MMRTSLLKAYAKDLDPGFSNFDHYRKVAQGMHPTVSPLDLRECIADDLWATAASIRDLRWDPRRFIPGSMAHQVWNMLQVRHARVQQIDQLFVGITSKYVATNQTLMARL